MKVAALNSDITAALARPLVEELNIMHDAYIPG
jgi:hypothetical protein